jgi:hypothetical protein
MSGNQWWQPADDVGIKVRIAGRTVHIVAGSTIAPWMGVDQRYGVIVIPPANAASAMPVHYTAGGEVIAIKELLQKRHDAEPDHTRITP